MKTPSYPYHTTIDGNSLSLKIEASKKPGCILYFFLFFALLASVGAIGMIIGSIIFTIKTGFGFIFTLILLLGSACYIFRLYLWNKRGVEYFKIKDGVFESYNDYKYFQDNRKRIEFTRIEIGYNSGIDYNSEEERRKLGIPTNIEDVVGDFPIRFVIDEEVIDSIREIPIKEIRKIRKALKNNSTV